MVRWIQSVLIAAVFSAMPFWGQDPRLASAGGAGLQVAEALALICSDSDIVRTQDGSVAGCRSCPRGTDFESERGMEWELRQVSFGHFTSAKDDNLLLSGMGCESHSSNFGGSFLFVLELGRPQFVKYHKTLRAQGCSTLALQDGRDFLICRDQWGSQGWRTEFVFSVVFDREGGADAVPIFRTEDTVNTCGEDVDGTVTNEPVQHSVIESMKFPDLNRDGLADLSLTVTLGKKLLTEAEREACRKRLSVWVATKEYPIEFLFDDKRFEPTIASKRALQHFSKPEFPW